MCRLTSDPIQRTIFIDQLATWQGDPSRLAKLASTLDDPPLRSALCLGVGSTPTEQLTKETIQAWQPLLANWHQQDADKSVHSAAGWALRNWRMELPAIPAANQAADGRGWLVNRAGMTMLKIPAGSFTRVDVGNVDVPSSKGDPQKVTLTRPFLLGDREVSAAQFPQFLDDPDCPATQKPKAGWPRQGIGTHPTPGHPATFMHWNEALLFCNWLSRREGLTPCYRRTGQSWNVPYAPDGRYEIWRLLPRADG